MTTKPARALTPRDQIPADDFISLTVIGSRRVGDTVEVDAYPPRGALPLDESRLAAAVGAYTCHRLDSSSAPRYRLIYGAAVEVEVES